MSLFNNGRTFLKYSNPALFAVSLATDGAKKVNQTNAGKELLTYSNPVTFATKLTVDGINKIKNMDLPTLPRWGGAEMSPFMDNNTMNGLVRAQEELQASRNGTLNQMSNSRAWHGALYPFSAIPEIVQDAASIPLNATRNVYNTVADAYNSKAAQHNAQVYANKVANTPVTKQAAQYASYLPAASNNTVVKQPAQYANYLPGVKATNSAQNNTVKNTIAKTLKVMKNSGQLNSNPQVAKGLINLYNRLK